MLINQQRYRDVGCQHTACGKRKLYVGATRSIRYNRRGSRCHQRLANGSHRAANRTKATRSLLTPMGRAINGIETAPITSNLCQAALGFFEIGNDVVHNFRYGFNLTDCADDLPDFQLAVSQITLKNATLRCGTS